MGVHQPCSGLVHHLTLTPSAAAPGSQGSLPYRGGGYGLKGVSNFNLTFFSLSGASHPHISGALGPHNDKPTLVSLALGAGSGSVVAGRVVRGLGHLPSLPPLNRDGRSVPSVHAPNNVLMAWHIRLFRIYPVECGHFTFAWGVPEGTLSPLSSVRPKSRSI